MMRTSLREREGGKAQNKHNQLKDPFFSFLTYDEKKGEHGTGSVVTIESRGFRRLAPALLLFSFLLFTCLPSFFGSLPPPLSYSQLSPLLRSREQTQTQTHTHTDEHTSSVYFTFCCTFYSTPLLILFAI